MSIKNIKLPEDSEIRPRPTTNLKKAILRAINSDLTDHRHNTNSRKKHILNI